MPRQFLVFNSNTMNFWRQSISGLVSNLNYAVATSFVTSGNIKVTGTGTAINVANGWIRANGDRLFGMNALAMFGTANNARLQNTSFNVMTTAGITGGANGIALGSTIRVNVDVADSITNTRTDIPASANSLRWAMQAANTAMSNATLITSVVDETRGGLGESVYTQGDLLIGNSFSGKLDKGTISPGRGIVVTTANGSMTISANLFHGSGMTLSSSGNSGITVVANGYQLGNLTQSGLIQLYDAYDSTSTGRVVTANAVNAVSRFIQATPGSANLLGRLIDKKVYTTTNQAGRTDQANGSIHVWIKPANTSWIRVFVMGGGGGGSNTFNTALFTRTGIGLPGAGGSWGIWSGAASDVGSSVTLYVGGGGYYNANSVANRRGGRSHFGASFFNRTGGAGGTEFFTLGPSGNIMSNAQTCIFRTEGDGQGNLPTDTFPDRNFDVDNFSSGLAWWQNQPQWIIPPNNYDTVSYAYAGHGGNSPYGMGGHGGQLSGVDRGENSYWCHGRDATGYGAGGGGSIADWNSNVIGDEPDTLGFVRGGNGAPGLVIVESFSLS